VPDTFNRTPSNIEHPASKVHFPIARDLALLYFVRGETITAAFLLEPGGPLRRAGGVSSEPDAGWRGGIAQSTPMPPVLQPLTALPLGTTAMVAEIKLPPANRPRLMEMGLLVGTPVELVRFAPLGDPVEIKVRGYNLTLRRNEAEQIFVRPAD
jgi:ferrous iron transport protein A